jgi:Flp pilus assembly pilin Flp
MRSTATKVKEEVGQTMSEYTIVLAVLTLGALATFGLVSGLVIDLIERTIDQIP